MRNRRFGLIGKDLSYSFSKQFFENKFKKESLENDTYKNFELDSLDQLMEIVASERLDGFNVTIPYKEAVIPILSGISDEAKIIGAVNTIKVHEGKLFGYNTDVIGFRKSIGPYLEDYHTKALILGTGGAAKAIAHVLKQLEMSVLFVSRTPDNEDEAGYNYLSRKLLEEYLVLINTTPLGTSPKVDDSPFPATATQFLGKYHVAYDLVYNPTKTKFLKHAENQGASIKNGLEMLEIQAEESWKIWTQ